MAVIETVEEKIVSDTHISNSLTYTMQKSAQTSYNLIVHRTIKEITDEFKTTRTAFNKDNNILSAHLVQSFSKEDNVSAELSHKIGIELMNRCLSNYQVVMTTHTDGTHIHNHFIINSVSPFDGKKFYDNNATRNSIRRISDELCLKYDLSIIQQDDNEKYLGLDSATLNTAKRGTSWKVQLVKDLDNALNVCKSKNQFIDYFISNDYEVKFTNQNITFKKTGEKKGIRADTLAKQFGYKYSKKSIDKHLGLDSEKSYNTTKTLTPEQLLNYYNQSASVQWKRYENKFSNKIKVKDKRFLDKVFFARNPFHFTLRLIEYIFRHNRNKTAKGKYSDKGNTHYSVNKYGNNKRVHKYLGNIDYKTITQTAGESAQIKLYAWQITKLLNHKILLSSKLDVNTGTGIVTIKKFDISKVAKILGINETDLISQSKVIKNRQVNYNLIKQAGKLEYLVITSEQVEKLKYYCIDFVEYKKGNKINIGFAPADKSKILSVLYPNRQEEGNKNDTTFFRRNAILNKQLKEQSEKTGEKICYKIVLSNQYKALRETDIEFAVFRMKDGNYNVVFLEHNKSKIENAIRRVTNVEQSTNKTVQYPKNQKPKI